MPVSVKHSLLSLILISFLAGSAVAQLPLVGDFNKDYRVNIKDLRTFAWQWLHPGCFVPGCIADIDSADGVNMVDFALMSNNWQIEESHLLISEFMASSAPVLPLDPNELLDGDGYSSDWIEIYNPTGATVSLDGWHLTDRKNNLAKWQFPDGLQIDPGEFRIVFASGKTYLENPSNYPYLDAGGYYHTNFELNPGGEYLALVAPDSNVVIHEYYPEYPQQLLNISYGLTQYATKLVPQGATVSYHVPTSGDAGLGTGWTTVDFNDSGWNTEKTGLGFGVIVDTSAIAHYRFNGDCSDNTGNYDGIPIGSPTYGVGMFDQAIDLDSFLGEYVWTGKTASDLGLNGNTPRTITAWVYTRFFYNGGIFEMGRHSQAQDFSLRTYNYVDNQWRVQYWGSNNDIDFTYDSKDKWVHFAHVHDGTATRIYANGQIVVPDTPRTLSTADSKTFKIGRWRDDYFNGLIDDLHVYDQVLSQEDIQQIMDTGTISTSLQEDMLGVNASLWIRTEFEIEDPTFYDILVLRMKYEDGFVAYINGEEVTRCNAPNSVEWNSISDSNRPIGDALAFEEINLMSFLHVLQPGINVLAIHGLNDNKDDGDFLILPELVAARNQAVPQYFTTATPKTFNTSGAIDVVEEVWLSHKRGFYDAPFQLLLSNGTKGAEIRYTRDGSLPTITHGLT
ncbi:MAG: LamG-like jellyroll fold domain-containing protein, partial [Planctomycetota bacterium]